MTWSKTAYSAAEQALMDDNQPFFVGTNHVASASPVWVHDNPTSVDPTGDDDTDSDYPTYRLFDGQLSSVSAATAQSSNSYFIWLDFSAAPVAIDTIALWFGDMAGTSTVNVRVVDTPGSNTNTRNMIQFASVQTDSRLLAINLDAISPGYRFADVDYASIEIINDGGAEYTPPEVKEVVLGSRLHLSYLFNLPADDRPLNSEFLTVDAITGHQYRSRNFLGRAVFNGVHDARTDTHPTYGTVDLTNWRSLFSQTSYGRRSTVFCPNPASFSDDGDPHEVYLGHLSGSLFASSNGPYLRTVNWEFTETGPTRASEIPTSVVEV